LRFIKIDLSPFLKSMQSAVNNSRVHNYTDYDRVLSQCYGIA